MYLHSSEYIPASAVSESAVSPSMVHIPPRAAHAAHERAREIRRKKNARGLARVSPVAAAAPAAPAPRAHSHTGTHAPDRRERGPGLAYLRPYSLIYVCPRLSWYVRMCYDV